MERLQFDEAVAALASRQSGVMALDQAIALGATTARVRCRVVAGRWERLARGVFKLNGAPETWQQRLWAAYLEAGVGAAISHASAARLLGFRGFQSDAVSITLPRSRHRQLTLARVHETSWLPSEHITTVAGLPCTTVARCVFDLAGDPPLWARGRERALEVHALRMARVFNNALADQGLTIDKMATVVAGLGRRGRSGTALMRRLLRDFGPSYVPTSSDLESMFMSLVRSAGLPEPDRQVWVGGDEGATGRVDFVFQGAKVVVEVDGGPWHDGPLDRDNDALRDLRMRAQGWEVIRVRWRQLVDEPEMIVAALTRAIGSSNAA